MGLSASASFAQFAGKAQTSKNPAINPDNPALPQGGVTLPGQDQLTPEQALGIMQLRALQSRTRGQVRTGIPQFIPMGPQGLMAPGNYSATPTSNSTRKSSSQKRAEARQARDEEKKNAADDDAKAKKSKTKKAKPVKNTKPAKKAKADEKPPADK
jgi:hypothetical protein